MALLEVAKVSKWYNAATSAPVEALHEVSMTAERGQWVAIMGPSGTGKTTLLHIVGCLDRATTGAVRIDSVDTSALSGIELARFRANRIGFIFQQVHLIPHLTALENVILAQFFHSMPDESEAKSVLAQVGIGNRSDYLPSQLSGGEQRLVSIARAIVNNPNIILADEPTGSVDADNEKIVLTLLSDFQRQGCSILMATHSERVARWSDRRIRLEHGRLSTLTSTAEESQTVDKLLRALLLKREHQLTEAYDPRIWADISRAGLVAVRDGVVTLSPQGEAHARSIVRRRRLAERLLADVFSVRDSFRVESNVGALEQLLRPHVVDRICSLLGHPTTCPHGEAIPAGVCCEQTRIAVDVSTQAT